MKTLFAAIAIMLPALCSGADLYVDAVRGSDTAAGTAAAPLLTPGEGLRRARELRRMGRVVPGEKVRVHLADGVYRLNEPLFVRPEDSGTPDGPTVLCGTGSAELNGGIVARGWKRGTDNPRIPESVRPMVWTAPAPVSNGRIVYTRQLRVDGRKAQRASQFAPGKMERMAAFSPVSRTITIPEPAADLSAAAGNGLEMTVHQRWAIAKLRVKDITPAGEGLVNVTFMEPESRLEFEHPWPQPVIGEERGNSSFFLANAPELLDSPGEWYQDYPSGTLYYYPHEDEDMATAQVEIPVLNTLVSVEGSRERPVNNVVFEGLTFANSAWTTPSERGHVTLQGGFPLIDAYKLHEPGLFHKAELENQAWIARPEAAVTVAHASGIDFTDCTFRGLGATGLDLQQGVSDSRVTGCMLTDIGGNGILAGAFPDRGFETHIPYTPADSTDMCRRITIGRSRVTDATNEDWGACGIAAGYVRDFTVDRNEVDHVNYSGICVGWGWTPLESGMCRNRITGNRVHHYAAQLYDTGGIYTLSNQPGSVISGNIIDAPMEAPYATNNRAFCIYFDEATDGYTVTGNRYPGGDFGYNRPGPALKIGNNGPHIIIKE